MHTTHFQVSVDGELRWGAGFEANVPRKVNTGGQTRELWNRYLSDIRFFIGPIPITVDFFGRLEGTGSLDTSSSGSMATGACFVVVSIVPTILARVGLCIRFLFLQESSTGEACGGAWNTEAGP